MKNEELAINEYYVHAFECSKIDMEEFFWYITTIEDKHETSYRSHENNIQIMNKLNFEILRIFESLKQDEIPSSAINDGFEGLKTDKNKEKEKNKIPKIGIRKSKRDRSKLSSNLKNIKNKDKPANSSDLTINQQKLFDINSKLLEWQNLLLKNKEISIEFKSQLKSNKTFTRILDEEVDLLKNKQIRLKDFYEDTKHGIKNEKYFEDNMSINEITQEKKRRAKLFDNYYRNIEELEERTSDKLKIINDKKFKIMTLPSVYKKTKLTKIKPRKIKKMRIKNEQSNKSESEFNWNEQTSNALDIKNQIGKLRDDRDFHLELLKNKGETIRSMYNSILEKEKIIKNIQKKPEQKNQPTNVVTAGYELLKEQNEKHEKNNRELLSQLNDGEVVNKDLKIILYRNISKIADYMKKNEKIEESLKSVIIKRDKMRQEVRQKNKQITELNQKLASIENEKKIEIKEFELENQKLKTKLSDFQNNKHTNDHNNVDKNEHQLMDLESKIKNQQQITANFEIEKILKEDTNKILIKTLENEHKTNFEKEAKQNEIIIKKCNKEIITLQNELKNCKNLLEKHQQNNKNEKRISTRKIRKSSLKIETSPKQKIDQTQIEEIKQELDKSIQLQNKCVLFVEELIDLFINMKTWTPTEKATWKKAEKGLMLTLAKCDNLKRFIPEIKCVFEFFKQKLEENWRFWIKMLISQIRNQKNKGKCDQIGTKNRIKEIKSKDFENENDDKISNRKIVLQSELDFITKIKTLSKENSTLKKQIQNMAKLEKNVFESDRICSKRRKI